METTNRITGDTNPKVPRVLQRGGGLASVNTAVGSLYHGSLTVNFPTIKSGDNPVVDSYADFNFFQLKVPGSFLNPDGTFIVNLAQEVKRNGDMFQLKIHVWLPFSGANVAVFWVIYSTKLKEGAIL